MDSATVLVDESPKVCKSQRRSLSFSEVPQIREVRMRVVSVINQKGGVGKTTTVMSLAALTASSQRVAVMDVDPQASSSDWAEAAEEAGKDLGFDVISETDPNYLAEVRKLDYDLVFVDTPGNLQNTDVLETIMAHTDFVLLPSEPAPLALRPLVRTYRNLVEPSGVDHRVLITRVDSRATQDAIDAHELLVNAGLKVLKPFVRNYKVHERAAVDGSVVTNYEAGRQTAKAVDDYKSVAMDLAFAWANEGSSKG
jgi:chromosome partitioning protein